jgi:hypothetical protein
MFICSCWLGFAAIMQHFWPFVVQLLWQRMGEATLLDLHFNAQRYTKTDGGKA